MRVNWSLYMKTPKWLVASLLVVGIAVPTTAAVTAHSASASTASCLAVGPTCGYNENQLSQDWTVANSLHPATGVAILAGNHSDTAASQDFIKTGNNPYRYEYAPNGVGSGYCVTDPNTGSHGIVERPCSTSNLQLFTAGQSAFGGFRLVNVASNLGVTSHGVGSQLTGTTVNTNNTAFWGWHGGSVVVTPSPTPTTPTPTPTTPTPTPTSTGPICTQPLGNNCGAYQYAGIPMSNGYDTYVANQDVGANSGTTETINVTDPGNWNAVVNAVPYGYGGVQTFPDVQQLTNDWGGSGWGNGSSNTPVDSLSALKVNYSESGPTDANSMYEFAPDVWTNYASDVMFWADTHGRCNTGSYGSTVLGTATFGGQTWTVNRYGGTGAEIIFVLDSNPSVPNSCAQQTSGTIDIKAGLDWLVSHGYISSPLTMSQLNTGWEITSADNTKFTMNSYSITATP